MRGNSEFLWKWFIFFVLCPFKITSKQLLSSNQRIKMCTIFQFVIVTFVLISTTNAGPVNTRHRRMMREVFSDLSLELKNNTQNIDGTCLLDGIQVSKSSVDCKKKNGCRAIQKTGYCCPDYQCECERDGKIYKNGEKIVDPETPCKVCYCQGGEILCNQVTCYIRNDCVAKFVNGRCCPEYENCPPLDELLSSSTTKSSSSLLTLVATNPQQSTKVIQEISNNPLGIKIKEITKAEEIRIIDEKPKLSYSVIKPNGISGTNQTKIIQQSTEEKSSSFLTSSAGNVPSPPSSSIENLAESKPNNAQTSTMTMIVVSENVNALENTDVNDSVNKEESLKTVRQTGNIKKNIGTDSKVNTKNEDNQKQQGEEVVIVDRNGQTKPIRVLGVEGLQRGDENEDTVNVERKGDKLNSVISDSNADNEKPSNDVINDDFEPEAAGSKIYESKIKPEDLQKISTKSMNGDITVSSSTPKEVYETVLYTSSPDGSDEKSMTRTVFETVYREESLSNEKHKPKNPSSPAIPSEVVQNSNDQHHHLHIEDDDTTPIEANPAYPTIPDDDLSIYGREVLTQAESDDYLEHSHKSKSAMQTDESKSFATKITTEGPDTASSVSSVSDEMIIHKSLTTEGPNDSNNNVESNLNLKSGQVRAPGEPFLVPEWERNTTESMNNTDDSLNVESQNQEIVEIDSGNKLASIKDDINTNFQENFTTEGPSDVDSTKNIGNSKSNKSKAPGEPFLIPEWERNTTSESTNDTDNNGMDEDLQNQTTIIDVDANKNLQQNFTTEGPNDDNSVEDIENIDLKAPGEQFLILTTKKNSTELTNNTNNNVNEYLQNQINIEIDPGSGSGGGSGYGIEIDSGTTQKNLKIIDLDDVTETISDNSAINLTPIETDVNVKSTEIEPISNIFDPNQQNNGMQFNEVFRAFHNFRKNYLNIF